MSAQTGERLSRRSPACSSARFRGLKRLWGAADGAGMNGCNDQPRRSSRLVVGARAVVVVALIGFMTGCGISSPPPGGDPGNKRLDELGNDRIFQVLPPGANVVGTIVRTPAQYRQPGFDAGGWDGPAVALKFKSAQPPASVFTYYAHRATELGWIRTGNKNVLGYPEGLTKTLPRRHPRRLDAHRPRHPHSHTPHEEHVHSERQLLVAGSSSRPANRRTARHRTKLLSRSREA